MQEQLCHPSFVITLSCQDRIGIVADVSRFLVDHGCNITDSAQFGDAENSRFFLRISFQSERGHGLSTLQAAFAPIARKFDMDVHFFDQSIPMRTLIMVSRMGHCLNDLLFRYRIKALPIDLAMIVSNHKDFSGLAQQNDIPFHLLPVTPGNKMEQEQALIELIEVGRIDLIVLARYMQVFSADLCKRYAGKIINIHHSFLPSFQGAQPYQRAHGRGVKMIGATAHYVTADLDEGPIIEQGVERVSHHSSVKDLTAVGRDTESGVLARAVKWHAEHRVLLNGNRTVIFT